VLPTLQLNKIKLEVGEAEKGKYRKNTLYLNSKKISTAPSQIRNMWNETTKKLKTV